MTDNNYTDEQIIKSLKCCMDEDMCDSCPIGEQPIAECFKDISTNALNLIKRLKAEVERLNSLCTSKDVIINDLNAEVERLKDILAKKDLNIELLTEACKDSQSNCKRLIRLVECYKEKLKTAKSETRYKFAERLKDKASLIQVNAFDCAYKITEDDIDNLLEEMEKQ